MAEEAEGKTAWVVSVQGNLQVAARSQQEAEDKARQWIDYLTYSKLLSTSDVGVALLEVVPWQEDAAPDEEVADVPSFGGPLPPHE